MTQIADIASRLLRLAKRREDEGIYTDASLCSEAARALQAIGPEPVAGHDSAALSGSGSGWRGSYRLLETTDTIQAGDEVIGDDGVTWCPVDRWSIGCEVSRLFKSIRRASPAAPQQGGE